MPSDADDEGASEPSEEPARPDLPAYVLDPLERQPPERLETIAAYASALAAHRRSDESAHDSDDTDSHAAVDTDSDESAGAESSGSVAPTDGGESTSVTKSVSESSTRVSSEELDTLAERGVSVDPGDYETVPEAGAYVTIKEPKPGYRYYYWQWREGDTWKNQYIAPVSGGE